MDSACTALLLQLATLQSPRWFIFGFSVAFLDQAYGILCDSESWGSWIFSFSFETEGQPGRGTATRRWGEALGEMEQLSKQGVITCGHTAQPSREERVERRSVCTCESL